MNRHMAHIVNPVIVGPESDLFVAQPITFQTMETARDAARDTVDVELFTAQYAEDRPLVPEGWTATPDLTRSVLDIGIFRQPRKLPLLRDILDRLYEATDVEYLIYTNVDIGLMPNFYTAVDAFISAGVNAFTINRRTISARFTDTSEIPLMYAEVGRPHPGNDCFIFRRSVYPGFVLGDVCIGAARVGWTLYHNLKFHSAAFREFKSKHLTFHIGDDRPWADSQLADYIQYNMRESRAALAVLRGD